MIRKAQAKFIAIIMAIIMFFFIVIFGASYIVLLNGNKRAIDLDLANIERSFKQVVSLNQEVTLTNGEIIATINAGEHYQQWHDESFYTEIQVIDVLSSISSSSFNNGSIGNIFYVIHDYNLGQIIIAKDMSSQMTSLNSNMFSVLMILLISYICLFGIVGALSSRVFNPLKESLIKQKQFISNASHELKTPLTIISANADILKQEESSPYVNSIKEQTERMNILVSDMLTLAKMDEGDKKIILTEFNLSDQILANALPFDALAFEKGKTLDIDVEFNINYKGDIQCVKQLINILLDNAIKHSSKNALIQLKLKKENGKIILTVSNWGSNVPTCDSNKIFERFYRGDSSRSRESGGSGLGLAIAKSLADTNKWKISAHSILNQSMTVTVIF